MTVAAETSQALDLARSAFVLMREEGQQALIDRFDEFFDPKLSFKSALVGQIEGGATYRGQEGFEQFWRDFDASFGTFSLGEATFTEAPSGTILIETRVSVTGAESGVPLDRDVVYVFRSDGERMVEGSTFFELDQARRYAEEGS